LPEKELKKYDLQKKKRLHFDFGRHFCKIEAQKAILRSFHTFCPNLHRYCPNFKGFFPDFYQIKILGDGLTPLALNLLLKTFTQLVSMPKKPFCPKHT